MPTCFSAKSVRRVSYFIVALLYVTATSANSLKADDAPLQADKIFDPTHVVEVSIDIKEEDWKKLCSQSRNFFDALNGSSPNKPFTYFKADVIVDGKKISNVGVRKKGFLGSLDAYRPSLKIKFDEYVEQEPSVGFDRLTLNNNKQDPSRMCQYLSYKMFNDSGTEASRCNFCRVTVNGNYHGIYSNVESIKPPFLEQRFGDDSGALYEGTVTDFYPDSVEQFEAKNKQAKYKQIEKLAQLMDQETFTLDEVEELLDVKAFVRFWATESLIGFWDGYTNNQNNYFVYSHPTKNKLYFIPWGIDSAFEPEAPMPSFEAEVKSVHSHAVLANRLYRHPEIQQLYLKTMNELLDQHWQEDAMIAEIDKAFELIKDHISESNTEFREKVEVTRSFVRSRRSTIDRDLKTGVAKLEKGARRLFQFGVAGTAVGTFSTTWSMQTPKKPAEVGETNITVTFQGEPIEFGKLGVTSSPNDDNSGPGAFGPQSPTIVFHGLRKSNNSQWMMKLETSKETFQPSAEATPVSGIVIDGNPIWFMARMLLSRNKLNQLVMVGGEVTFDEADREVGAPISGKVEVDFGKIEGGDYLPIR